MASAMARASTLVITPSIEGIEAEAGTLPSEA